jgi:transposase
MGMTSMITEEWLAAQTPDVQAVIRFLLAEIERLKTQVAKLTPQNSSLPPSSQHPHARPPRKKGKNKRKRGGQQGHPRHERTLLPTEQCNEVVDLFPNFCRRCATLLQGQDGEPLRHQVWELPKIEPHVTEFRQHRLTCPCCGETTCAVLPVGVPQGQSGPRLVAFTGLLMGHFRQSKRRAALFLQDLLGFPCSPSLTVKMQNQVGAALEAPYEELKEQLSCQPQLNMDETPTKQANQKAWLWTAVALRFAVFAIFATRKATALSELVGDAFSGIINCDRAKMYWQAKRLQWCWAHLQRDIQALIDHHDPQVKRLGYDLMRQVKAMFIHWKRYKAGKIRWNTFRTCMDPVRYEVNSLLLRGRYSGNRRLKGMCDELWRHREWLWMFVDVEGIEPTNNTAERALRPAVIYRKLSFGTQSEAGSRFIERMLTVCETCRLQQRSIFNYLVAAVEAHYMGTAAPSLAPTP